VSQSLKQLRLVLFALRCFIVFGLYLYYFGIFKYDFKATFILVISNFVYAVLFFFLCLLLSFSVEYQYILPSRSHT
jgi:hypothetical protein